MRIPHTVPLPVRAIELLTELKDITGWGVLLFPSLRSSKRPMSENTLNNALRRMGYTGEEMTSHGFRATFSTLANESGLWHPDAIERALAHVERNEVRGAYARGAFWDEWVRMADWRNYGQGSRILSRLSRTNDRKLNRIKNKYY